MAAPLRKRAVGGGGGRGDATNKRKTKKLKEIKDGKKPPRRLRDEEISSEDDEWAGDGGNATYVEEDEVVEAKNVETADEKRLRLAQAFLERTRQAAAGEVCMLRRSIFCLSVRLDALVSLDGHGRRGFSRGLREISPAAAEGKGAFGFSRCAHFHEARMES